MKKSFASILLIFAFASVTLCQISGQQPLIKIDSLPIPDALPKETQSAVKGGPASLKVIEPEKSQGLNQQENETAGRAWISVEYLSWKTRSSNLPPLITVAPGNQRAELDEPGTVVVFGGRRLDQGTFPGGRVTAGLWLNKGKTVGAEVSYFFLEKKTFRLEVSSSGLPGSQAIARPYIFVDLSRSDRIDTFETADTIAAPGFFQPTDPPTVFSGTGIGTFSSRLQGAEASMLYRLGMLRCCRLTLLTGFRYLDLNEALTVTGNIERRTVNFGAPSVFLFSLTDQFNTRNQFYGGQAGLRSTLSKGRLGLELSGTIAIGSNRQTVNIQGVRASSTNADSVVNAPEGLLAIKTNIGRYSRNQFTFIPEVRANLGFDLTRAIRPFIGYQFLYWHRVVMPGEQIDRFVNFLYVVGTGSGPRLPAFGFRNTTFWARGLTTGVKVRF